MAHHIHTGQTSRQDGGKKKDCPLCHNSILIAKGTEQAAIHYIATSIHLLVAYETFCPNNLPPGLIAREDAGKSPLPPPSTLLALHCALLN